MGLIDNLISGAIGYGISEASKSHPVRDLIDNRLGAKHRSIEDIIDDYAHSLDIYTFDNDFARELHRIAKKYEGYGYTD